MPPPRPRLRVPDPAVLEEADGLPVLPDGTEVLHACLRLITPAILGGADARSADCLAAIRSKAVRGHLRHWWRLLAAAGAFAEWAVPGGNTLDDAARLRALEFDAWGTLAAPSPAPDAAGATPAQPPESCIGVDVRLAEPPTHTNATQVRQANPDLALALFFACVEGGRSVVVPPWSFELAITVSPGGHPRLPEMLARTVLCWATLSGVGGRTSRGMGAVQLDTFDWLHADGTREPLPCVPDVLQGPPAAGAVNLFGVVHGVFIDRHQPPASDAALQALGWGLQQAMTFLQVPHGRPAAMAMSRWPEARLIRHLADQYYIAGGNSPKHHDPESTPPGLPGGTPPALVAPRIAFGHRMIRYVKAVPRGRADDPQPHAVVPKGSDRLPSSVLIRPFPVPGAPGRYGCLVVQRDDLAGGRLPTVRLRAGRRERVEVLQAWSPDWQAGQKRGCAGIAPLELPACHGGVFNPPQDAGQAFINFVLNTP